MEDAAFPHLGESSRPLPRACPPRCSCPRADTVDCNGMDLQVFPDNITRAAQHLSLQVGPRAGRGRGSVQSAGVEAGGIWGPCWACGAWQWWELALMRVLGSVRWEREEVGVQILEVRRAESLEVLEVNVLAVIGFFGVSDRAFGSIVGVMEYQMSMSFWLWGCLESG